MTTLYQNVAPDSVINFRQPVNHVGKFTVVYTSGIRKFEILDLAIKFFNSLEEQAVIWDVTNEEVQLIKLKD